MLIAVNTQLLLPNKLEGIGWFTYHILSRLTRNHPEHTFLFIFDRPYFKDFVFGSNVIPIYTRVPSRHPILWYYRFEYLIPRILKEYKADLFLSTDGWSTLNTSVKRYTVIHDLNFVHDPKNLPFWVKLYYNYFSPRFARASCRLGTVSEYSKQDISREFKIEHNKIDVIYNAPGDAFRPISENDKHFIRKIYSNDSQYFVFVGALNRRKNIVNMLKAYDMFRETSGLPVKMLIVGKRMFHVKSLNNLLKKMKYRSDVHFTGHLQGNDLAQVVASALALVLVSRFEGFGIPIVEAMKCDVPVITSNVTAMPEVASNAALLCDPLSVNSICCAMRSIASDEKLRCQLIEKGKQRSKDFSWDVSAEKIWIGMMKCI